MNVSTRWLSEFLRRPLDAADVAARLALLGAPADAIEPAHADLSEIMVGLVQSAEPHPNADRLRVCRVDDGSGTLRNVVCGAANVAAGHRYPFAPVGATLPGGLRIEKRKLRGEVSEGMLCSARELGLGEDQAGLWELATDAAPGTPLLEAVPLADTRLVLDITPNRPDLLCHKGIARELAAAYQVPFRLPSIAGSRGGTMPAPARALGAEASAGEVRVAVEDAAGCPRLLAARLTGVTVGPSPDWLRRRLEVVGVRSINNVVDATNYVMLELNQPMHAYDAARLRGPAVIARRGRSGETLTTLDGVTRPVDGEMTVIADAEGVIGIGGVMGGRATEVTDATTELLLECASFDASRVRRTRRALNLSTEASYRFERGVDRWNGAEALRRCVELIETIGGAKLVGAAVDVWPQVTHPPRIFLRPARVAAVLGVDLPWHAIEQYLVAIGATVVSKPDDGRIAVDVPGWRPDLVGEIDLIEEIARLHGYDAIPTALGRARPGTRADAPAFAMMDQVRRGLVAEGLFEVSTLPLSRGAADRVSLLNPLSANESALRASLLPGLIHLVELNWAAGTRPVRLFEIGTVFHPGAPGSVPGEETRAAGVISGGRAPAHWTDGGASDVEIWELKALFTAAQRLVSPRASVDASEGQISAVLDGRTIGWARRLDADAPPWAGNLFGFELVFDPAARRPSRFEPLPVHPSSRRDVTFLVPESMPVARVIAVLEGARSDSLEPVRVSNEYRSGDLPAGLRSVTFQLTFRANDRTLETGEVDRDEARLLAVLGRELGLHRRDHGAQAPG